MSDYNWPEINFNVTTKIVPTEFGWGWEIKLHIIGPDVIFNRYGGSHKTKEEACLSLIKKFSAEIEEMINEFE